MADAPSHTDVSVLYLPLMPETSKLGEAMVQAGKDATESFGKGSSGIGDKIHESFSKSKDKIKDVFHRSGSDAAEAMADGVKEKSSTVEDAVASAGENAKGKLRESAKDWGKVLVDAVGPDTKKLLGDRLEETVGSALEGVLGDNAKWAGKFSHTVADWGFDELKNKLGDTKEAADKTKKAFADFGKGDVSGGVAKLVDGFGKLGGDVKDLPEPLQGILGDISDMQGAAEGFAGIFKDLPGVLGKVGTAIEGLAGPIGVAAAAAAAIWNGLPGIGGGLSQILSSPSTLNTSPSQLGLGVPDPVSAQTPASQMALPGMPQPVAAASLPPGVDPSKYTASQGDINNPFAALGAPPPGTPSPSSQLSTSPLVPLDMPDGVAPPNPHPFLPLPPHVAPSGVSAPVPGGGAPTVPLVQKPDGTWTSPNPAWAHLIARESGGRPSVENDYDSNAQAGDPSRGLFQFTRSTWARSGGGKYGPDPGKATPQQQAEIAANLIRSNPSGSDWGAGMSGRESASGLLSGLGGATSTGWWGSRNSGGSGDPSSVLAGGGGGGGGGRGSVSAPIGNQHDPIYTTQVSADGSPTGGGSGGDAAQQLGSGFLGGIMQSVGLDGSVFKTFGGASNPLDFGATKMATGLLNWGMGMAQQKGGGRMPGMGGSIPGAAGLGESPTRGSGGYTQNNNIDNSMTVHQNGVQGTGVQPWAQANNSRTAPALAGPAFTGLP